MEISDWQCGDIRKEDNLEGIHCRWKYISKSRTAHWQKIFGTLYLFVITRDYYILHATSSGMFFIYCRALEHYWYFHYEDHGQAEKIGVILNAVLFETTPADCILTSLITFCGDFILAIVLTCWDKKNYLIETCNNCAYTTRPCNFLPPFLSRGFLPSLICMKYFVTLVPTGLDPWHSCKFLWSVWNPVSFYPLKL